MVSITPLDRFEPQRRNRAPQPIFETTADDLGKFSARKAIGTWLLLSIVAWAVAAAFLEAASR
jgi:hypothetical protein